MNSRNFPPDFVAVDEIRSSMQGPFIVTIGSKRPSAKYDSRFSIDLGYSLRQDINDKPGTLFTGGVTGIGVDTYIGIIKGCLDLNYSDDRFFVLVAEDFKPDNGYLKAKYMHSGQTNLNVQILGKNHIERRWHLSLISDYMITLNGESGTLEEALVGLEYGKSIITLPETGGVAELLAELKEASQSNYADLLEKHEFDPENYMKFLFNADLNYVHVVTGDRKGAVPKVIDKINYLRSQL